MERLHLNQLQIKTGLVFIKKICTYGFLNWRRRIKSMALQNINAIKLQTLKAMLYSIKDVLRNDQSAHHLLRVSEENKQN